MLVMKKVAPLLFLSIMTAPTMAAGVESIRNNQSSRTPLTIQTGTSSGPLGGDQAIESQSLRNSDSELAVEIKATTSAIETNIDLISTNATTIAQSASNTNSITEQQVDHNARITSLESRIPVQYRCSSGDRLSGNQCYKEKTECKHDNKHYIHRTTSNTSNCPPSGVNYWGGGFVSLGSTYTQGEIVGTNRWNRCKGSYTVTIYKICGPVSQQYAATPYCPAGYQLTSSNNYCKK